ncbi:hypothetical protein TNCV_1613781 [Trichonephila clavipes]|nr:hypothetical protein TNCV_1613781 [Trichonephila clavipes]
MKFRLGDFSLKDELRSGRSYVCDEVLRNLTRTNPILTSTEVGFKLGIHQTSALDYIKMLDLACLKRESFLDFLVTGDENWKSPPVSLVRKLAERVPGEVSFSSLDYGSKLRGSSPIALGQL